jgi:hypothetical protein
MPRPQPRDRTFLIVAGAVTALFLPFALAFPPSLLAKLMTTAVLVALACGVAAIVVRRRK